MNLLPNVSLYLAAILTFCAALLHFICVFWGANGFRFLGAGKSIVQMVERGDWYPNLWQFRLVLFFVFFLFMLFVQQVALSVCRLKNYYFSRCDYIYFAWFGISVVKG